MTAPPAENLFRLLRDGNFFRVWMIGGFFGVSRWLELLSLGIYVFDTTASPFFVALLIILRMTPLFLFGAFVGTLADRFNAKKLLIGAMAMLTGLSAVMVILFLTGVAEYWHVATAAFLSGLIWAIDIPVRRQLLGDIAGPNRVAQAMGLDSATNNATRMLGPLIGGILYQWIGIVGAFSTSLILFLLSALLLFGLDKFEENDAADRVASGPIQDLLAALRYVRNSPTILAILGVTVVFNIWGFPFMAMVPVIGKDVLDLAPSWIGFITALEGAGAFLGALAVAAWAPARSYNWLYYFGTMIYLFLVFLLGWSQMVWSAGLILFVIGLAISCFSTMQSTLVYLVAPEGMRGRIFGLLVICIGTGLIGFANVGLMAEQFGAPLALKIIACEGMAALALVGLYWYRTTTEA